jgi:hypothetical protein
MRSDRVEYFATYEDQERLFSKIDSCLSFQIVERCFRKGDGPTVFPNLRVFHNYLHDSPDITVRRAIYYASKDVKNLQSRDVVGSNGLVEFDLINNPDVLTFTYGEQLSHDRLLLSQIGRSKASREAAKLLSKVKQLAKDIGGETSLTTTGELVLPNALTFADRGGRLVRTPDSPTAFDSIISR